MNKEINIKIPGQILDFVDTKEHLLDLFNYITNLQTIEQQYSAVLSENAELQQNYDKIYNENCKLREQHNITDVSLLDENYKLKELCNKYEEEHNTTFQEWQQQNERLKFKIDSWQSYSHELEDYKSRCEKAIELINNTTINCEGIAEDLLVDVLNILQGGDE